MFRKSRHLVENGCRVVKDRDDCNAAEVVTRGEGVEDKPRIWQRTWLVGFLKCSRKRTLLLLGQE